MGRRKSSFSLHSISVSFILPGQSFIVKQADTMPGNAMHGHVSGEDIW